MVDLRGDCFKGDNLEPRVLDRPRSEPLGDAGSGLDDGETHVEMRSVLLGEGGGVSLSCAIFCSRFWMPAKSICNLLSRLSKTPGRPEQRRVGDATFHTLSWSASAPLCLAASVVLSGLLAGESPKNMASICLRSAAAVSAACNSACKPSRCCCSCSPYNLIHSR